MTIWNEGAYDTEQLSVLQGAYADALTMLDPAEQVIAEEHYRLAKFIMGLASSGHRDTKYLAHTAIAWLRNDADDQKRDSPVGINSIAPST